MDLTVFTASFTFYGLFVMWPILLCGVLANGLGFGNLIASKPLLPKWMTRLVVLTNVLFLAGFLMICLFHWRIYTELPLELADNLATWLNQQLAQMNARSSYSMPLYDTVRKARYAIPLWIENEKYFFWFFCYAALLLGVWKRIENHRLRGLLQVFLGVQLIICFFFADPFAQPLPRFFAEIAPWFEQNMQAMARYGLFMKLYPRMIFYYNASYMWLHPPMLFVSYACITVVFGTSTFMLFRRELPIEILGYDCAKLGYFMLTLGMLLGYPWALQAWGPNWWWDPKICSSIMMWAVYSTYLHTRLYANKPAMWYFTSILGILCFLAMIFTFITSFYFPGEHTFQ